MNPIDTNQEQGESWVWFKSRLDQLMERCDATVAHILSEEANTNLSQEFSLPNTDDLLGLPVSSRGTNAYAQATKALKERLVKEIRAMESNLEQGFGALSQTERSLNAARKEVKELRSVLAQYAPTSSSQQQQQQQLVQEQSGVEQGSLFLSGSFSLSSPSQNMSMSSAFPADIAVSLSEEQSELKQLQQTLSSLQSELNVTRKTLNREKTAFKDTCDTAVKCNSMSGAVSLRS